MDIYNCQSSDNKLLFSKFINQSEWDHSKGLPLNAFHAYRLPNDSLFTNGSNCYIYEIGFDKRVQIWFITIELWTSLTEVEVIPDLMPVFRYRTCRQLRTPRKNFFKKRQETSFIYQFICDLNNPDTDYKLEQSEKLDRMTVHINTTFKDYLGLEALYISEIYTKKNKQVPDCGMIQAQNIGTKVGDIGSQLSITCNDSFIGDNQENE